MRIKSVRSNASGFTLLELILVMALIIILFTIITLLINPKTQFQRANDSRRRSDVSLILNAIGAYTADNRGIPPTQITTAVQTITDAGGGSDLCSLLVPKYTTSLPADPSLTPTDITTCSNYNTGYTVVKDSNNRVTVSAPLQETGSSISVSR